MMKQEGQFPKKSQDEEWLKFIDTLSHELKTPLTSILAAAGLLSEELETAEEAHRKLIQNILHNATILEARLVEVIELVKSGGGQVKLRLEPIDVKSLLQDVVWQVSPLMQSRRQNLSVDLPDSLPHLQADGPKLEQAVINLMTNATKYTPESGSITLKASTKGADLVIEVKDSGQGISREEQEKLFKPYSRLSADRRYVPGLGLGLALAKQIVELHGGKIWVESEAGMGSKFAFSIPLSTGS